MAPRAPADARASAACKETGENATSPALDEGGGRCLARRSARAVYLSQAAVAAAAMVVIENGDEESCLMT